MEDGSEAKAARQDGDGLDFGRPEEYPGQHPGPAVGHMPVEAGHMGVEGAVAPNPEDPTQQMHANQAQDPAAMAAAADAAMAAAADAAAAAAAVHAATDVQHAHADAEAQAQAVQAAAAAAQLAALNAQEAQQAAQQHEHSLQELNVQAQLAAAAAAGATLDPAQAAALAAAGGVPVSAAMQFDPQAAAAAIAAAQSLNIQALTVQGLVDHNGQQLHVMPDGLQLQAHDMYAHHHQAAAPEDMGEWGNAAADVQRQHIEGQRKADYQALAAAKRSGHLATIQFTLDLPQELADVELTDKTGIVEVPDSGDVMMLKRLFQYQAHNKLLPALQTLLTEQYEEMQDTKEDGTPMPLSHYNVGNGSSIILKITVPDELDNVPMVDEALASAAYTSASSGARTPSRKTRWTTEQIEALIEGVEKYGLSAWRTIVMDPRLASKNNMQCKDKFRNLCLTIIQGRPERGLTLPWQLKDRVRALIEQENIKGAGAFASMGGMGGM